MRRKGERSQAKHTRVCAGFSVHNNDHQHGSFGEAKVPPPPYLPDLETEKEDDFTSKEEGTVAR